MKKEKTVRFNKDFGHFGEIRLFSVPAPEVRSTIGEIRVQHHTP